VRNLGDPREPGVPSTPGFGVMGWAKRRAALNKKGRGAIIARLDRFPGKLSTTQKLSKAVENVENADARQPNSAIGKMA
jgi:hypothetical protein